MIVTKYHSVNKLFLTNGREQNEAKKQYLNNLQKKSLDQSVHITISKEGLEKCCNGMMEEREQGLENSKLWKEALPEERFASRTRNTLMGTYNQVIDEKKKEGRYLGTVEDTASSILESYVKLYDEIIRGYEDGTRMTYEVDESQSEGYRLLTKEEELELLDAAYKEMVEGFEIQIKNEKEWRKAAAKDYKGLAEAIAAQTGRNDKVYELLAKAKEIERLMKEDRIPENLNNKLMKGMNLFKTQYAEVMDRKAVCNIIWKSLAINSGTTEEGILAFSYESPQA